MTESICFFGAHLLDGSLEICNIRCFPRKKKKRNECIFWYMIRYNTCKAYDRMQYRSIRLLKLIDWTGSLKLFKSIRMGANEQTVKRNRIIRNFWKVLGKWILWVFYTSACAYSVTIFLVECSKRIILNGKTIKIHFFSYSR